jgi:hypothetical protein
VTTLLHFVPNPLHASIDVGLCSPLQFAVGYGNTSTNMMVWYVQGVGYPVNKEHTMRHAMHPCWVNLRTFDTQADAVHVLRLLQAGELAPEELQKYMVPSRPARTEAVETVADIHRGIRRRRR